MSHESVYRRTCLPSIWPDQLNARFKTTRLFRLSRPLEASKWVLRRALNALKQLLLNTRQRLTRTPVSDQTKDTIRHPATRISVRLPAKKESEHAHASLLVDCRDKDGGDFPSLDGLANHMVFANNQCMVSRLQDHPLKFFERPCNGSISRGRMRKHLMNGCAIVAVRGERIHLNFDHLLWTSRIGRCFQIIWSSRHRL